MDLSLTDKLFFSAGMAPTISASDAFWYFVFAGCVWLFFDVLFRRRLRRRRIAESEHRWRQMRRELLHSLRSLGVFGLVGGLVVFAALSGWTQIYLRIEKYGWAWFFMSIGVMIVLHDAYFYWTHRLMHHPRLFRRIHRTHHLSTNPSPWAAYSFSAGEAVVQAGIGPLVVFLIPTHPAAFSIFMIWQITFNVMGHCGYEIWPRWFLHSWLGCLLNSPTHHAMHHETFRANFGLYFNIWDRLMGTNHADYANRFAQVTAGDSQMPGMRTAADCREM
jgi:Delta7-sterol 5-desaturase